MEEMFDTVRGLISEAKGRGDGYVVDHLDEAGNWLNTIEGQLKLGFTWGDVENNDHPLKDRLDSLYRHLTEEGWHVHANTVALALEAIVGRKRGRPSTNFDKRAYQAQYMRDKRAAAKLGMTIKEYKALEEK